MYRMFRECQMTQTCHWFPMFRANHPCLMSQMFRMWLQIRTFLWLQRFRRCPMCHSFQRCLKKRKIRRCQKSLRFRWSREIHLSRLSRGFQLILMYPMFRKSPR